MCDVHSLSLISNVNKFGSWFSQQHTSPCVKILMINITIKYKMSNSKRSLSEKKQSKDTCLLCTQL